MANGELGFTPNELVEQDGPNKGNVVSEIGQVGAEAHEDYEDTRMSHGQADRGKYDRVPYSTAIQGASSENDRRAAVEQVAMNEEVRSRAESFAIEQGKSPAAAEIFGKKAVQAFKTEQEEKTKQRIEAEVNDLSAKSNMDGSDLPDMPVE